MKKFICVVLCALTVCFCLSACSSSSNEMSEENITRTVETVDQALKDFDSKKLEKYVESSTLSVIMSYAEKHDQFKSLGKAIFASLDIQVKSIDIDNSTVTVTVKNKDLTQVAQNFAQELKANYSTIQLIRKLNDEEFLDSKLNELTQMIDEAPVKKNGIDVTLGVKQGKKNLILTFDDAAENVVSGGALTAIKTIYGN